MAPTRKRPICGPRNACYICLGNETPRLRVCTVCHSDVCRTCLDEWKRQSNQRTHCPTCKNWYKLIPRAHPDYKPVIQLIGAYLWALFVFYNDVEFFQTIARYFWYDMSGRCAFLIYSVITVLVITPRQAIAEAIHYGEQMKVRYRLAKYEL